MTRKFSLLPSLMLFFGAQIGCQGNGAPAALRGPLAGGKGDGLAQPTLITPSGQQLKLCGGANLQATNQVLGARARFVAAYPDGFPDSYYGIHTATDAYVCITTRHSDSSTWTEAWEDGLGVVSGPFTLFDIEVYGFRTDKQGHRIDVTGDGVVDMQDWHELELRAAAVATAENHFTLGGKEPQLSDTFRAGLFSAFYSSTLGAIFSKIVTPADGLAILGGNDADGYPNHMALGANNGESFSATVSPSNSFRCDPAHTTTQQCFYSGSSAGTSGLESYPGLGFDLGDTSSSHTATWSFANNQNNWLLFDPAHDTFNPGNGQDQWIDIAGNPEGEVEEGANETLTQSNASLLKKIQFQPAFWVRAKDAYFSLNGQIQTFPF